MTSLPDFKSAPVTVADAPFNDPDADVVLCSADNVHFRVYKLLLGLASPVFKDMFRLPQPPPAPGSADESGRPIIPITEDRRTVDTMLRFCYPSTTATLDNLGDVRAVLEALIKYDMRNDLPLVRNRLASPDFIKKEPLRVFAIAYRYKLKEEAILAVKESVHHPFLGPLVSELEHIPASGFYHYLKYRALCAGRVYRVVDPKCASSAWSRFAWAEYANCGCWHVSVGAFSWRFWFFSYVRSVVESLHLLSPETLADSVGLSVLDKACGPCATRGRKDLPAFIAGIVVPEMRKAISEVSHVAIC